MRRSLTIHVLAALAAVLMSASVVVAQDEDDAVLKLAEPDFTLIALPTSLRLPKFKSAFRVTHRFTRPLGQGDFGDLAADLFGIDSGAQIGLEYRFGIVANGEIGIHRTSIYDKMRRYGIEWPLPAEGPPSPEHPATSQ